MDVQDLPDCARQDRLPAWTDQGLPQGRPRPVPGAGAGPGPHQEDPRPAALHPGLVPQVCTDRRKSAKIEISMSICLWGGEKVIYN